MKHILININFSVCYFLLTCLTQVRYFTGLSSMNEGNCTSENQALTPLRASLVSRRLLFVREVVLRRNDKLSFYCAIVAFSK